MTSLRAIGLVLAIVAVGCAARTLPVATDADAARMAARLPGTTAVDLNNGRELLLSSCGNCHQVPVPSERKAAEWPSYVQTMQERAGVTPLEAQNIERYLAAFAKDRASADLGGSAR